MAETFVPPSSSNVKSAEWDAESEDLKVSFTDGSTYLYRNLPHSKWRGLQQAESTGGFLARHVKGRHQHERLSD